MCNKRNDESEEKSRW
jgi:hypothetical protein